MRKSFLSEYGEKFKCFDAGIKDDDRFHSQGDVQCDALVAQQETETDDPELEKKLPLEHAHLWKYQIVLNMSCKDGMRMAMTLRQWLLIDIFRESMEMNGYIALVVSYSIIAALLLMVSVPLMPSGISSTHAMTSAWIAVGMSIPVNLFFVPYCLNLIISANQFLGDFTVHILEAWKEHWMNQASAFTRRKVDDVGAMPIGWYWNETTGKEVLPTNEEYQKMSDADALTEIDYWIANVRGEAKQKVLGFVVTIEFKRKLLASLSAAFLGLVQLGGDKLLEWTKDEMWRTLGFNLARVNSTLLNQTVHRAFNHSVQI